MFLYPVSLNVSGVAQVKTTVWLESHQPPVLLSEADNWLIYFLFSLKTHNTMNTSFY